MREKLVAFIKYVGAAVVGAVLSWFGLGCDCAVGIDVRRPTFTFHEK